MKAGRLHLENSLPLEARFFRVLWVSVWKIDLQMWLLPNFAGQKRSYAIALMKAWRTLA